MTHGELPGFWRSHLWLSCTLLCLGGGGCFGAFGCTATDFPVGSIDGSGGTVEPPPRALGGAGGALGEPAAPSCSCDFPQNACIDDECVAVRGRTQLAVGIASACAIRDGELWCWGRQQGTEPLEVWEFPRRKGDKNSWVAVSTVQGESYCGLDADNVLYCWGGENRQGNLGQGGSSSLPIQVSDQRFQALFYGSGHGCALDELQELYCWGRNTDGDLGVGDTEDRRVPTRVSQQAFATVAVGWGHTCAIDQAGALFCWGRNLEGQLGLGTTESTTTPIRVGVRRWRAVSATEAATCAIDEAGALFCWGDNRFGRLGTGDEEPRLSPTKIGDGPFFLVSAGHQRTCVSDAALALACWGLDGNGDPEPFGPADEGALRVSAVHAGRTSSCVSSSGDVYCWGENGDYALGLGDTQPRAVPTRVDLP